MGLSVLSGYAMAAGAVVPDSALFVTVVKRRRPLRSKTAAILKKWTFDGRILEAREELRTCVVLSKNGSQPHAHP